ncbi:hypothetical protein [Actinophytocola algeriensis]|uniref:Uncharacterized protein n=1 Tax=Actinophytocola algeriensis TaxID=1768010 RepID=A0A7W7VBU2_9PSEU|nr:hypothetical protein [Actinophytocola algeriensis]MBB4904332.1 hypothetical protein [Actinophytocola algeriensis]MBE1476810.1 hypothetical protein [Actinophytocola algeriensis]
MATITLMTRTALADALLAEDNAEDNGWLDALDRMTCPAHRRWLHQCCHSDLHVSRVSGHRWCRPCGRALEVAVDEVARTIALHCPTCGRGARTRADAQLVAACEASLTASVTARTRTAA